MRDYLWDPNEAPPEPFAAELERRLSPLGEDLDELLDELELADELADDPPQVVSLRLLVEPPTKHEPKRERGWWPWMAAAVVLLSASVAVLAHDQRRRMDPAPRVEVGGAGEIDGRVRLGVGAITSDEPLSSYAVLVELRNTHGDLARCAVALEPGAGVDLSVTLRLGGARTRVELHDPSALDPKLASCLRASLAAWDGAALGRADIELDIHLHNNRSEEQE
jgi:hypothetical protein